MGTRNASQHVVDRGESMNCSMCIYTGKDCDVCECRHSKSVRPRYHEILIYKCSGYGYEELNYAMEHYAL